MHWKNEFETKTLEDFMKKLFENNLRFDTPLKFFNRKVILPMRGKTAEMVLATTGTSGNYEAIDVAIIHKDNGVISSERFKFKDYLMDGYEAGSEVHSTPKVIDHCGTDWYMNGPEPKAIRHLMSRIREYVTIYND